MRPEEWQTHVDAFSESKQTKRAFTEERNLSYSQFLYWYNKLTEDPLPEQPDNPSSDFISIDLQKPHHHPNLGTLELPNGSQLVIHDTRLLAPLLSLCMGQSC